MRAIAMRQLGQPELLELPEPAVPRAGEVKVEMELVAISIAEVRAVRGNRILHFGQKIDPASPFVLGFAGTGRIVQSATEGLSPGQRVVMSGLDACGDCPECRAGYENHCPNMKLSGIDVGSSGFACEYVTLPGRRVFPLPPDFKPEHACVVSEVATCIHAVSQGRLRAGEGFGVVGAGRHGRQLIRVAKRWGASPIVAIDPDEEALARSRAAGADIAVKPRDAQLGRLDVVVHANSDESSLALSCDLADKLGRVVLLGTPAGQDVALPDFLDRIVIPEREIIGTDSKNPHEYREAIKLMSSGDEDWDIRKPRRVSMAEAPAILRRAAESWPLEADMFIEMRQH